MHLTRRGERAFPGPAICDLSSSRVIRRDRLEANLLDAPSLRLRSILAIGVVGGILHPRQGSPDRSQHGVTTLHRFTNDFVLPLAKNNEKSKEF